MIDASLSQWLESHTNNEKRLHLRIDMPTLERMKKLCTYLGDPQEQFPAIHITGTNGKTSTTRIAESLVMSQGLYVGAISSPHLSYMSERICVDGKPVDDHLLSGALSKIRMLEESVADIINDQPSYFEVFVAAAYDIFSEIAIDVGVIEVGMGGLFDATNVCNTRVAVFTNVGLDHIQFLGGTKEEIAREKSGIIKPGNDVVISERDPAIAQIFVDAAHAVGGRPLVYGEDFELISNEQAVGGRIVSLRTPYATHSDVYLPLFGAHQAYNAASAVVAVECFIDAPLSDEVLAEGFGQARSPGRMEIISRDPLIILDGAHNVDGAQTFARALDEEFARSRRIYVMGLTAEKDPTAMINALNIDNEDVVIATQAQGDRAMPVEVLSDALRQAGIETVIDVLTPHDAIENAQALALDDDHIVVVGSLYVVGAIRALFL